MDIVTGMLFLGYSLFIRRFIRWPIESLPLFLTSFIIVLFYIFTYVNFLDNGSRLFILIGALLLISSPLYLYKERAKLFNQYITPGFVFFVLYLLIFKHITHGYVVYNNDEVNRWVPHIQFINFYHRFWKFKDIIGSQDYPPAGALLNYFFLKLPGFAESRLYFIHAILHACPFIVLFRLYRWRDLFTAGIAAFLIIKLFSFLMGPRLFILMDGASGLFFGGILTSYFLLTEEHYLWVYLCITACAFVLFKPMLYPFLLFIAAVIFIDQLYLRKINKSNLISLCNKMFFFLSTPALFLFSWNYYVNQEYPNFLRWGILTWQSNSVFTSAEIHLVIHNFLKNLPLKIILYIALTCSIIYFFIPDRLNKKRFITTQFLLFCGYIVFLFSVLMTYLSKFTLNMAIELNSFDRFVCIYQLGWILAVIAQSLALIKIPEFKISAKYRLLKNMITIIKYSILLFLIITIHKSIHVYHKHKVIKMTWTGEYLNYALKQVAIPLNKIIDENAGISVIWMGGAIGAYMQYILEYQVFPRPTKLYFLDDSNWLTTEVLKNFLTTDVNYLIVGYVEPVFWQQFGSYFKGHKPLTFLKLCFKDRLENFNSEGCKMHNIPIYLYKVVHENGEPKMIQV